MKLNKLLIASSLAIPAVVTPLGIMTSCSNTWGYKTPVAFGSHDKTNKDNPFVKFATADYLYDLDHQRIFDYLPSNYSIDTANSAYYSYYTPVQTWWTEADKKKTKESDPTKWTEGSSSWYSNSTTLNTEITDKDNHTQTCYKNVTLEANTAFTATIAQYIEKYLSFAISYQASQFPNNEDLKVSWGGQAPYEIKTDKSSDKTFTEWLYANANAFAQGKSKAFMKMTRTNFNYIDFPIPAYTSEGAISPYTVQLLAGSDEGQTLGETTKTVYWSKKEEVNKGKDDHRWVYTYPAVPVLVRTTNATQRWINPQVKNSHFVTDYYQDDKNTIQSAIGKSWSSMDKYCGNSTATIKEYDFTFSDNAKPVTLKSQDQHDLRLDKKDIKGTDFVAFITYYYTEYEKAQPSAPQKSVTLGTLSTIMPAYMFALKDDLFTKANTTKDINSGWIVDTSKADKYASECLNILNRSSKQGRIGQASKLNDTSKEYMQFLAYMFSNNDGTFDFTDRVKTKGF